MIVKEEQKMDSKIEALEGKHFDIGVAGIWYGSNYGSVMTYYALYHILTKLGYSVLMIDKMRKIEDDIELKATTHARIFAAKHYPHMSPSLRAEEMPLLNKYCDAFLMGCDQVWNYGIARNFGLNNYFGYVSDENKKISYASSFGHNVSFTPEDKIDEISKLFERFDAISVREEGGVRILKNEFGIEGTQVVDPVFLPEQEEYDTIIADSKAQETEKYMLSYILDPTPEIREALIYIAEKKNLKLINLLDGRGDRKKNTEILNLPNIVENLDTPTWLWYIKNAAYVVTDSCHGASFSLIFERPFVCIANRRRGVSRFESFADLFDVRDRFVYDVSRLTKDESLLADMDYSRVREILAMERKRSIQWLQNALQKKKKHSLAIPRTVFGNDFDFALLGMNDDSYGDILGYYALYQTVTAQNYSVLMVKRPKELSKNITPLKYRLMNFANRYYPIISNNDCVEKLSRVNDTSHSFVAEEAEPYRQHLDGNRPFIDWKVITSNRNISKAFLLEEADYETLINNAACEMTEPYLAYDCRNISDGLQHKIEKYAEKEALQMINLSEDMPVENWLFYVKNAKLVFTNQRDVLDFALIFRKQVVVPEEGMCEEIRTYLHTLKAENRILADTEKVSEAAERVMQSDNYLTENILTAEKAKLKKNLVKELKKSYKKVNKKAPLPKRAMRKAIRMLLKIMPVALKEKMKEILHR